jgi:hypothetical protein
MHPWRTPMGISAHTRTAPSFAATHPNRTISESPRSIPMEGSSVQYRCDLSVSTSGPPAAALPLKRKTAADTRTNIANAFCHDSCDTCQNRNAVEPQADKRRLRRSRFYRSCPSKTAALHALNIYQKRARGGVTFLRLTRWRRARRVEIHQRRAFALSEPSKTAFAGAHALAIYGEAFVSDHIKPIVTDATFAIAQLGGDANMPKR